MSSSIGRNNIGGKDGADGTDGANGANGVDGAWTLISTVTASNDATVEFTGLSSTYFKYMIVYDEVRGTSDSVFMAARLSSDNGTSYDGGASDYQRSNFLIHQGGERDGGSTSTDFIGVAAILDNTNERLGFSTNENVSGTIEIFNPSAAEFTFVIATSVYRDKAGQIAASQHGGYRASATAMDAIMIAMSSGNIFEGTFKLYGLEA